MACCPSFFNVSSGVPQGSHLGPILFILYINDLPSVFENSECKIYADDVKIYRSIKSVNDSQLLQTDLNAFNEWCLVNKLFLNIDKCKVINFTRKNVTLIFPYHFDGIVLNIVDKTLDLGIYIDCKLNFKSHIDYILNRANSALGFIYRESRELSDRYCLRALFYALVRSLLEYACPVWSPIYVIDKTRLESVQRRFLRFALRNLHWSDPLQLPSYDHRLALLNMPSLERHREFIGLSFICNLLNYKVDIPKNFGKITF